MTVFAIKKWTAFIGPIDDKPCEIFTGLADDEGCSLLPRWVNQGLVIKNSDKDDYE